MTTKSILDWWFHVGSGSKPVCVQNSSAASHHPRWNNRDTKGSDLRGTLKSPNITQGMVDCWTCLSIPSRSLLVRPGAVGSLFGCPYIPMTRITKEGETATRNSATLVESHVNVGIGILLLRAGRVEIIATPPGCPLNADSPLTAFGLVVETGPTL